MTKSEIKATVMVEITLSNGFEIHHVPIFDDQGWMLNNKEAIGIVLRKVQEPEKIESIIARDFRPYNNPGR